MRRGADSHNAPMDNRAQITARDLSEMVGHWVGCPPGGYLGSDYGADVKALIHSPMASGLADGLLDKCRQDVPLLSQAGQGALNIYAYDGEMDRKILAFDVLGEIITVGST